MSLLLKDKVAVVTGSTRGIGFAIAKEFAENNGAITIVCSRKNEQAERAIKQISGGKVFAAEIDVSSDISVKKFTQQILSKFGQIDILVNNAGYPFDNNIWYKRFHEVTDEELQKIMAVDVQGSIRVSRAVISSMIQKNTNENSGGGVIINISSTPAIAGHTEGAPYTIAKAANIALTKCIAKEYGINGIRSYTMALGNIATMATYDSMTEVARKKAAEEPPMKRWGRPEEVAKVAASIASDSFSFATGNTIVIDGGTVLW
ncbi:MAG: SDR family oxidoreductase [Thermoproteota archaeon]|jgi:3-oxoacyl-[acyl-carrier protein] reductase|nr:SDR family oxidoreductase [Thermoproteota archaeon]